MLVDGGQLSSYTSHNIRKRPEVFRRMFALGRPYWKWLSLSVLLSVASVGAWLLFPLGLRSLIDSVVYHPDHRRLTYLTLGLLVLFSIRAAMGFIASYLQAWAGEKAVADLRIKLFSHLESLKLSYFTDQRVGDLTSRLTNDIAVVRRAIMDATGASFLQVARLIGSIAIMLVLNSKLCFLVLLVMPLVSLLSKIFGTRLQKLGRELQDQLAYSTVVAEESFRSISVVKAFTRETYEINRYRQAVNDAFHGAARIAFLSSSFTSFVDMLFHFAIVSVFWYSASELLAGRLTAGDVIAFFLYSEQIAQGVSEAARIYSAFTAAAGASERLFEIFDLKGEGNTELDKALPPATGSIKFQNVSFKYETDLVLRDLSLTISAGETLAVVGPSGAGKSTLLSLIGRFYDPTEGAVLVDGHDIRNVHLGSLREEIAFVPQDVILFSSTVKENIRYGRLHATDEEIEEAARAANAHEFILSLPLGYDTEIGERGIKLSGGQRQRLSMARAFLRNAPILLLDEPTSAIDASSEALIQQALQRLTRSRTTIIVAHRLATVRNADRIIVLDKGRIVQEGTHDELLHQMGPYRTLAKHQFFTDSSVLDPLYPDLEQQSETKTALVQKQEAAAI